MCWLVQLYQMPTLRKLVNTPVGFVSFVQEVDDHDIVLLAVAMATPDALLDALRIPGEIVVHHE